MEAPFVAPVLSTPAEESLQQQIHQPEAHHDLSDTELDIQYEVKRTIEEIRSQKWRRVGLQFPDEMLVDAPRVLSRLSEGMRRSKHVEDSKDDDELGSGEAHNVKLTILGDTSYGSCCVDEIAAEHIDADGVVHYGRTCLSPTQRLPVVFVFTTRPLDFEKTVRAFTGLYDDKAARICLLADVPWQHHLPAFAKEVAKLGYTGVLVPDLIHDPSSVIPNRALTQELQNPSVLAQTDVFHIGDPPTALLLTLSSKVKSLHILPTDALQVKSAATSAISRRRYASLLKLSSASVIGILINTLSVKNYLVALEHVQSLVEKAGKKSYVFVVGKLNPAKLANFAEVSGWVVIGCWESSLIDSKEFLAPVVTPFELELALQRDDERIWGQEWIADFETLLTRRDQAASAAGTTSEHAASDAESDDEPPEFNLRTGRYVSHSRPMATKAVRSKPNDNTATSTALAKRGPGHLAAINGVTSPGADYLRTRRDWQGLGSDFEVAYDRDENGNIQGAAMEQGRAGVAKGYSHSEADGRH